MEDKASWHGKAPNDEEYCRAMDDLTAIDEMLEEEEKTVEKQSCRSCREGGERKWKIRKLRPGKATAMPSGTG